MATSSITGTSSTPCAASRWPCSTWSIASSSSLAVLISAPSKRCWRAAARSRRAAPWSGCWRWPMIGLARPNSPRPSIPNWMPADCPIWVSSNDASRPIPPPFPTSPSNWCRCIFTTNSAPSGPRSNHGGCGMKTTNPVDAARLALLLVELRLPAVKLVWADLAAQADKEGWPAARFLAALAEHEAAERSRRRIERHLAEAKLPPGKTIDTFDFEAVPVVSKAQVMALAAGDAWLDKGANLILFGPPGTGKSHLAAALGFALVEGGWRVLFARTTDLVQRLQIARRELALEAAISRLDKYHLLILDDLAYVTKDQAETSVLFELIGARYERRSLLVTANQPFGEWGKIFPDPAMTLAVVDRLVHHATIFEMNIESYRRRTALERKRGFS